MDEQHVSRDGSGAGEETARWWVYLLVSVPGERRNGSPRTYVGITLDVERRLSQHNGERPGGARATRGGRPWRVARTLGPYDSRGRAQQVEAALKRCRGLAARMAHVPAVALDTES